MKRLLLYPSCLCLILLGLGSRASGSPSGSTSACDKTTAALETRGLRLEALRALPTHLFAIEPSCEGPETPTPCCPEEVRSKLAAWTSAHFRSSVDRAIREAFQPHVDRADAMEDLVDGLLRDGPRAAQRVLRTEGGFLADRRGRVLDDLFQELGRLEDDDADRLTQETRAFFVNVYERILLEIQSRDTHPNCTLRGEKVARPVFEAPEEVVSVAHSVRTFRTLVLSLRTGHAAAGNMSGAKLTSECLSALYRMNSCPMCVGRPDVKPCKNFCLDVMDICLAEYGKLNVYWRKFADVTIRLADQIRGPAIDQDLLNLDRSIGIELTRFIDQVKRLYFENCGVPGWKGTPQSPEEPLDDGEKTLQMGLDLKKMANEAKELVKLTKGFWANLPFVMCSNLTNYNPNQELFFDSDDAESESVGCWTGTPAGVGVVESNTTGQRSSQLEDESRAILVQNQILRLERFTTRYGFNHVERNLEKQKREKDDSEEGSGETDIGDDEDYVEGSGSTTSSSPSPPYQTSKTPTRPNPLDEKSKHNSSTSLSGAFFTIFFFTIYNAILC